MARYRKADKLTQEQRKDIALLVNAGISRKLLAKDYKISIHTIHAISRQRRRWIEEEQITTNKEQKFQYAQTIHPQLNPRPRKYVFNLAYEPVIRRIQKRLIGESQERLFFKAVLGPKCLPNIDRKALAKYRARIKRRAWVLIRNGVKKGVIYDNVQQAVVEMGYMIGTLEAANWGPRDRRIRDSLTKGINQVLKTLTSRERGIVKLRYGIEDGHVHILRDIATIVQISFERVRQIENEAIGKLQDPQKASELKKLIDSPPLRHFVQRPLAKTSRGFRHL